MKVSFFLCVVLALVSSQNYSADLSGFDLLPEYNDLHSSRVHAHTRLSQSWLNNNRFTKLGDSFADLGASVVIRHFKSAADQFLLDGSHRNKTIDIIILDGDEHGIKYVAYYWLQSNSIVEKKHPEFICRNKKGNKIKGKRGYNLDITSAYKEYIVDDLMFLAEKGVAGFYFDSRHLPLGGCFGTEIENDYNVASAEGGAFHGGSFLSYHSIKIYELFEYLISTVKRKYPDIRFVVSQGPLSTLVNPLIGTSLTKISDYPKSEFTLPLNKGQNLKIFENNKNIPIPRNDVRIGLGMALLRDSAYNRPPHIWLPYFDEFDEASRFVWSVLSYGGIANLDVPENYFLSKSNLPFDYSSLFELGDTIGRYLEGSSALSWGGVYFSEAARNSFLDLSHAWANVLWPINVGYQCFVDHGFPVNVINDLQLNKENISKYSVIVTPNMSYLTENAVEILTDYSVNGGLWVMADINNLKRAGHDWGMCKEIISAEVVSPISVSNLPAKVHSNFFKMKNGNYMVSIVNDFTNIKTSRSKNKRSNESKVVLDVVVKTNINPIVSVANAVNGEVLNYTCNNNKCDIFVPSFYDGIFIEIRFY